MTTDFNKTLGGKIKKLRQSNDMSQTDLGKAIKLTFQQIQKYENGKNRVSTEKLNDISKVFNVSPLVFFPSADMAVDWPTSDEECKLLSVFRKIKSEYHRSKIFRMIEL